MYKEPNKFQRFVIYGGTNKQGFREIRELIAEENYKVWRILSIILEILFIGLFIFFLAYKNELTQGLILPFGILAGIFIIVCLAFLVFIKPKSKALLPLIYLSVSLIFAIQIWIVCINPYLIIFYFAFIIAFASLVIDKPFRYPSLVIICSFIIGVIVGVIAKDDTSLTLPILYLCLIIFTLIACGICVYCNFIRVKELSLRRNAEIARDIDTLTGVKNKLAYEKKVAQISERIDNELDLKFAVAVFDINGLKVTNDTYGHDSGDQLIIRATNLIISSFPHTELFRIGGDEFAMIITDEDYVNRERLIRDLHEKVERAHQSSGSLLEDTSVAFGIGIYNYNKDDGYGTVFTRADAEMYNNKKIVKAKNEYLTPTPKAE